MHSDGLEDGVCLMSLDTLGKREGAQTHGSKGLAGTEPQHWHNSHAECLPVLRSSLAVERGVTILAEVLQVTPDT